jgi:hypothetical protein
MPPRQSGRSGKDAGEVALIGKATSLCNIGQRHIGLHQKISGQLDALGQYPLAGQRSHHAG